MSTSADLLVLGAGPAGLAAAWRAARQGLSVIVLDRADSVGGMAASFTVGGVRVDHGSHRLHPAIPPHILHDLKQLLGDDLQLRRRNGRLRLGDRWVKFPLHAREMVGALPAGKLVRAAGEAVTRPLRRGPAATYADVLRSGLGSTLYELVYAPYAQKLWGLPGEKVDADQARRRVSADTPWKVVARMLRPEGAGRVFYYPRKGFGQIVEALADAAVKEGAQIRLAAEVEYIAPTVDEVAVGTMGGQRYTAGHVFSTIPLPILARICRPGPPLTVIEASSRLRFRAMVLVYAVHLGSRPWSAYDAHYLPGLDTPIARISEPANYRLSLDDPTDRTVLCCEIPCSVGDDTWNASDDDLAALVTDTVGRLGLPALNLGWVYVKRLRQAYPIYDVGYRESLQSLDRWAGELPRVTTFGRLGLFVHDNTHHALIMAYDAANALSRDGFDHQAWAAARERFASHVVED
ncbi:FAD-dependent oxidoreductase [Carbonactinospora thermoautotrophica]|uniref:protoporphyrinogen/coproporphyrinogen oxidase n=1 Tax=Carbonactinospora thermoautotrophica TaxID=1469144 RepID=UPI00226EF6B8|nr:FAD-dependent oxidoreductase [Carbonactinospora thermoautotrophica]MCX9190704.1 FAD-dependent oxidoreductase [Carbonactinospora thermoautotrophica]